MNDTNLIIIGTLVVLTILLGVAYLKQERLRADFEAHKEETNARLKQARSRLFS